MIPPVGGIGGGLSLASVEGLGHSAQAAGVNQAEAAGLKSAEAAPVSPSGEAGGFGSALTEAIGSLEQTQNNAASASQALATGTTSDPEQAVVTVQDAQLAMELASQIRAKATEAVQNVFNTQV